MSLGAIPSQGPRPQGRSLPGHVVFFTVTALDDPRRVSYLHGYVPGPRAARPWFPRMKKIIQEDCHGQSKNTQIQS